MPTTLDLAQARDRFPQLAEEMARHPDREAVIITEHAKPVLALLSYQAYESLLETLAILGDLETAAALQRGRADVAEGRTQALNDVLTNLGW